MEHEHCMHEAGMVVLPGVRNEVEGGRIPALVATEEEAGCTHDMQPIGTKAEQAEAKGPVYHPFIAFARADVCRKAWGDGTFCGRPAALHVTEPSLGLATTRQLLEELEVRGRGGDSKGQAFANTMQFMLKNLPSSLLEYRTAGDD